MSPTTAELRPAFVDVDLSAIRHNVAVLRAACANTPLCAVVKADGYGHGAAPVARAALDAGAAGLGVALVEEGAELRAAGLSGPILVLAEPSSDEWALAVGQALTATVCTAAGVQAATAAASDREVGVHLKVDTGMHRIGCSPDEAVELARMIDAADHVVLDAVFTHCAVADEPDRPFTAEQLERFGKVLVALDEAGLRPPLAHAANSAGILAHPDSHLGLVRAGIALYGIAPAPALAGAADLRPAMSVVTRVSQTRWVEAGEGVSYGLRWRAERRTQLATLPVGYGDGIPRRLGAVGGSALIGGTKRPIAGTVTMDQLVVDCGPDGDVDAGDEAVLLGRQGDVSIGPEDWAERLGTIAYEIVTRIGPRLPRRYRDS